MPHIFKFQNILTLNILNEHISTKLNRLQRIIYILKNPKNILDISHLNVIYFSFQSIFFYGILSWCATFTTYLKKN